MPPELFLPGLPDPLEVMDAAGCGLLVAAGDGRIEILNQAAEVLLAVDKEKLQGRLAAEILPPVGDVLRRCLVSGTVQLGIEVEYSGRLLVIDLFPLTTRTGAVVVVKPAANGCAMADRQVKRQLDAIFDSSYDGLFITDGEGTILKCNRSSERLIGHKQEDIVGKNVTDLIPEGYIDQSVTVEVLKKKTSMTILQRLRNGKTIIVTGTPVFDDAGKIAFVVTNERDITALNRMKHELRRYRELARLQTGPDGRVASPFGDPDIKVVDPKTFKVFKRAEIAAKFDATVLIQGETGVGKGRMARFMHEHSPRLSGPFVQINCGAIPEQLIESELFGYRRGAFTGAAATGKPGLFHMADRGTLFLDEISEVPMRFQVKFLKAIEDREILSVGGTRPHKVDVRIIAANKPLEALVAEGRFRGDLFFRLNVVPIHIPPLRDRHEDIVHLASHFLGKMNAKFNSHKILSPEAMTQLLEYDFPGNIRELENIVERTVILCTEDEIRPRHLMRSLSGSICQAQGLASPIGKLTLKQALARYENELIQRAIRRYGSKSGAARALGVDPSTIIRKIQRHDRGNGSAVLHT